MALNRNFIFLMALSLVGEGFLVFSFSSSAASDIVGVAAAVLLCIVAVLAVRILAEFYAKKQFRNKVIISCVISFLFCTVMILAAFNTAYKFSKYAATVMLPKGWTLLPFGVILFLSVITAVQNKKVLLKLGLVLFIVSAIFILLMFCFSLPFMNVKYLVPYKNFSFPDSIDIFKNFSLSLLPVVLPAVVLGKEEKKRGLLTAFILGGGVLFLCFVNTLAVFGSEFAATLSYPYSSAVSTAEFGELFYRMDEFLYAAGFFSSFAKISTFLTATFILLKEVIYKIILRKI